MFTNATYRSIVVPRLSIVVGFLPLNSYLYIYLIFSRNLFRSSFLFFIPLKTRILVCPIVFTEAKFFIRGSVASISTWVRVFVALVMIRGAISSKDCLWLPDLGVSSWVYFDDVGSWSEAKAGDDEVDSTGDGWSESVMNSWVSVS